MSHPPRARAAPAPLNTQENAMSGHRPPNPLPAKVLGRDLYLDAKTTGPISAAAPSV